MNEVLAVQAAPRSFNRVIGVCSILFTIATVKALSAFSSRSDSGPMRLRARSSSSRRIASAFRTSAPIVGATSRDCHQRMYFASSSSTISSTFSLSRRRCARLLAQSS